MQQQHMRVGKRLLSTMLTTIITADATLRWKRNALCNWRSSVCVALSERRRGVGKLRAVARELLAVRLQPAVVFWRRMTMVRRAERDGVRSSYHSWFAQTVLRFINCSVGKNSGALVREKMPRK